MSTIIKTPAESEGDLGAADARADLVHRAEIQGVEPFTSLKDFARDPALTANFDVNEFLQQVREDRDYASNRNSQ
jgi:hypothetical protein